LSFPRWFCS